MYSTKQVYDIIVRESGIHYHHIYIYTLLRRWGFKQKVPRKTHVNVNTASKEEKERFKKEPERYWIISKKKKDSQ